MGHPMDWEIALLIALIRSIGCFGALAEVYGLWWLLVYEWDTLITQQVVSPVIIRVI